VDVPGRNGTGVTQGLSNGYKAQCIARYGGAGVIEKLKVAFKRKAEDHLNWFTRDVRIYPAILNISRTGRVAFM